MSTEKRREYDANRYANRTPEQVELDRVRKREYYRNNKEYCNALNKKNHERNKEVYKAIHLKWYHKNKERIARKKAGVSVDAPRPDKCSVCGSSGRIVLDHCHQSVKFRGWICSHCNSALGMARDSPEILRALADYLERHIDVQKQKVARPSPQGNGLSVLRRAHRGLCPGPCELVEVRQGHEPEMP